MNDPTSECVVVVPAYQAGPMLSAVLSRLNPIIPRERTLVVDDGSSDATSDVARTAGVHVIRLEPNGGKGAAVRAGMTWWMRHSGWQALITMDADGQHAPEDLLDLVREWKRSDAGVVMGERRFAGVGMPWERQLSNRITSALVSWRTGQRVPDSQCGFRLHSRRAVDAVVTVTNGFEAETEWLLRAAARGFRFSSAPVQTIYAGERSSMTYWNTTWAFIRTLFMEV